MGVGAERLVIRAGEALKALCQQAADMSEMNLSEWCRGALEQQAMREVRPSRSLGPRPRMPASGCIHPVTARRDLPTKVVCGLCDTVVKVL